MDTNELSVVRCSLSVAKADRVDRKPRTTDHGRRTAFTLVELLVVITIIAILSALVLVGANAARRAAFRARIKAEMTEIATGFEEYKNKTTAYPPNCQTDFGTEHGAITPATQQQIYTDLKRHMSQAFPLHREPDELLLRMAGLASSGQQLAGGMRAGEAVVFWLSGFSSDEKYPISGEGGPSYLATLGTADPIENRNWTFEFDITRLVPRADDGNFDQSENRYILYTVNVNGVNQERRINFWQYTPRGSEQPYLYLDTSRYTPEVLDPPASSGLHVHALKRIENPTAPVAQQRLLFATPDKYQILHCGIDDAWGDEFERTSYEQYANDVGNFLAFPTGPFTGEMADTIVNFTTESTLEDSQP